MTVPKYRQVADAIGGRIRSGQYRSGQALPATDQLRAEFNAGERAVRDAMRMLEREGLIHARKGSGRFVGLDPSRGYTGEVTERPATLDQLVATLAALPHLPPVERARLIPGLIEAAKGVLSRERGAALDEATKAGATTGGLAQVLGVTRSKVVDALAAYRQRSVGQ